MNIAQQYIQDVIEGNIVACRYVRLAVERHINMLATAKERGIYFDIEAAQDAVDFISILRHTSGEYADTPFRLAGWQAFIIWVIFGWHVTATSNRLINKAYVEVAKKNGKTELAAAIAIYMFFMDGEFGAEVYIGATKRAQAGICFRAIKQMVRFLRRDSEYARKAIAEPMTWNVHSKENNSKIEPLGKDSKGDQGINTHCAIIDEYHVHPDTQIHDNLTSSMVSRRQPLDFIITTAGMNIESDCYRLRKTSTEILEGIKQDDSMFAIIFAFDEGDDWENPALWQKPIPNLNVSVRLENILSEFRKAVNEGASKLKSFKTFNLNMWQASNFDSFIADDDWQACKTEFDKEELKGRLCFGGLDMAATSDIAATAYFFPAEQRAEIAKLFAVLNRQSANEDERQNALSELRYKSDAFLSVTLESDDDEKIAAYKTAVRHLPRHRLTWKYYLPGEAIEEKERQDKVKYSEWSRDGFFTLLPSNVILSEEGRVKMKSDILAAFAAHQIKGFGFDRWNAYGLVSDLTDEGISNEILMPFGMGYKSMSTPMNFFRQWVKQGELEHLEDPVIRWMVSNVIAATDGENIKPDRKKSSGKIDGFVAACIAIGQYFIWQAEHKQSRSIYENSQLWQTE